MTRKARKILLPSLIVTELAEETDDGAIRIALPKSSLQEAYFVRPKQAETHVTRGQSTHLLPTGGQFNLFPLVLDAEGIPWAEANIYLLSRIKDSLAPAMSTYSCIADDLAAYRRFLDDSGINWMYFPAHKLSRPTYRYNGHLRLAIAADEISSSTAKRRMSSVIAFYTWLISEGVLAPEHSPWKASDRYIELKDTHGFKFSKLVTTTDVSLHIPKQNDPYAGIIDDGGKLRPLTQDEQAWLIDALISLDNTEMTLIHLFALLTGARIQTILTFRVRHVLIELVEPLPLALRFPVGPGTGIDTKNDKHQVLHIPTWFFQILQTYAHSERAKRRRQRATGGDALDQYLFLSIRGTPMYQSKAESKTFNSSISIRHTKAGQGIRQFITERVLPFIRAKHNVPSFNYQFHDTRATFGMNLTDAQLGLVSKGEITLHEAREFVKSRMCHASSATTDRYLQYRKNLKIVCAVSAAYDNHLRQLAERAFVDIK